MKAVYTMVAMRFIGTEQIVRDLREGARLVLRREPTNEHDHNAVQVLVDVNSLDRLLVAYIKGSEVAALAKPMDRRSMTEVAGTYTAKLRWPSVVCGGMIP